MARLSRLDLPLHLHHVCVRGNNAQPIAKAREDLDVMWRLWLEMSEAHLVKVHGYAFLAQSVPARDAAAMAVYVHGLAGQRGGRYLIADDLEALLQPCLQELAGLKAQISS